MGLAVGFIGFGEAGPAIAKGLRGEGITELYAFDVAAASPDLGPRLRQRAAETGTGIVDTVAELAERSEIIFSTVVPSAAVEVAKAAAPHLTPRHFYLDLNAASPAVKKAVEKIVTATGARFVEAAVMAVVPPHGHKVPMLLAGRAAQDLVEKLAPYGMRLEVIGDEVGQASATKMCRSVLVKGIEALVLECLLAASRFGVEERVFKSMNESYPGLDWDRLADYLMGRTAVHGARRGHEMEEAARTLEALGVEPIMAAAAARRLLWCAGLGLKSRFASNTPKSYREVLQAIREAGEQ